MLKDEVTIGGMYRAKISGRMCTVTILEAVQRGFRTKHTAWLARNESTGKTVTIKSAQKLRRPVTASTPTPTPTDHEEHVREMRKGGAPAEGCTACVADIETVNTSAKVREALEWSWNVGIAEELAEDTIRHNAQWIADGIGVGSDQDDSDLVQDFLDRRCVDGIIDDEWVPDEQPVADALRKVLFTPKEGE